jgi:hypothetical protein
MAQPLKCPQRNIIHQKFSHVPCSFWAPPMFQLHRRQLLSIGACAPILHVADAVKKTTEHGHVIFLRLMEEQCNSLLPVYIGEPQHNAQ